MNRRTITRLFVCLALVGTAGLGATGAIAETEPNNTSGTANVIALDFQTGGTDSGKLRAGNQTPDPRDQDYFKFTNTHGFATIDVTITPSGIDGSQQVSYEVLTVGLTPVFAPPLSVSGSPETQTITSPNPGATFFIRVFDDGNLSSASGDANYSIVVTGTGGVSPLAKYLAKERACKRLEAAYNKAKAKAKKTKKAAHKRKAAKLRKAHLACQRELAYLRAQL